MVAFLEMVTFLGYIIYSEGIEFDPKKTKGVKNYPIPSTPTDIRSFLGLVRCYRMFLDGFASFTSPLTTLTQRVLNLSGRRHVKEVSNFLRIDLSPLQC